MDRVGRPEATLMLETLANSDAPMRAVQIRVLGGATGRVAPHATAYAHRKAPIMVNLVGMYTSPADKPKREAWVDAFKAALTQDTKGAYVNFLTDEGAERVREAYPGTTWDRLAAVKAKYDPRNLFRRNQNIGPVVA